MSSDVVRLSVYNIGGIDRPLTVEFRKGVNVIEAPNASGKTSLIRGLVSFFSPTPPDSILNVKATEGYVELVYNGRRYRRVFRRCGNRVRVAGEVPPFYDERAVEVAVVTPENRLLARIMAGEDDIGSFLAEVSRVKRYEVLLDVLEELLGESLGRLEKLKEKKAEDDSLYHRARALEGEVRRLRDKLRALGSSERIKALSERLSAVEREYEEVKALLSSKKRELKEKEE